VGDEDEGCTLDTVEVEEELEDVSAVGGIEVAGWFVGEDDGWPKDEGAGESDALLLAAGELDWIVVEAIAEADAGEEFAGAGEAVLFGVGVELVGEQDVLEGGERGASLFSGR